MVGLAALSVPFVEAFMVNQAVAPPAVLAEVLAFAAGHSLTQFLPAVLEMTRRRFPDEPVRVLLEEDTEIEDYRYIVIEVGTASLTPDQFVAAHHGWPADLLQHCPSTHAVHFVLGIR